MANSNGSVPTPWPSHLNTLRVAIVSMSAVEIALLVKYYSDKLELFKYKTDMARQSLPLWRSKYRKSLLYDILLHLFLCPPGLDVSFNMLQEGKYRLLYTWDMICACVCLMRLHIFI